MPPQSPRWHAQPILRCVEWGWRRDQAAPRNKGFLLVTRNATQDFADYMAMTQMMSFAIIHQALGPPDSFYTSPGLQPRPGAEASVLRKQGLC